MDNHKVVALARGDLALNLDLTGVTVEKFTEQRALEARMRELMESGSTQVLIVEETFRDDFSEIFREQLKKHGGEPLIVYCPSFEEAESNVDAYLSSIIRPAVGFEIRLE